MNRMAQSKVNVKSLVAIMVAIVMVSITFSGLKEANSVTQLDRMTQISQEIAKYKAIKPNVLIYSSTVNGNDENVGLEIPEELQAEWLEFVAKIMDPKIVAMKAELQALVDEIHR